MRLIKPTFNCLLNYNLQFMIDNLGMFKYNKAILQPFEKKYDAGCPSFDILYFVRIQTHLSAVRLQSSAIPTFTSSVLTWILENSSRARRQATRNTLVTTTLKYMESTPMWMKMIQSRLHT